MWEEVNFKAFDPKVNSTQDIHIEGINSGGLLVSRAAEFAVVVEMQIIRNILLGKIRDYEKSGLVNNVESQVNFFTLSDMTFFNYKGREIVLLPPVMGAPLMECIVQNANSLGANYFVRLGTTGSLSTTIPKYSFIVTKSSVNVNPFCLLCNIEYRFKNTYTRPFSISHQVMDMLRCLPE